MPIEFQILIGSSKPIYQQLVDQVGIAVATGALTPEEQLPSVRAVAERLVINPNTVARAYSELVREGLLEAQPGKGLFVAERRQKFSDGERARRLNEAVEEFVHKVARLDFSRAEILGLLDQRLSLIDGHGSKGGDGFHG